MIEPLPAHEPKTLGRYRLLGILGAGGMGRVLLATGPDGRFVAVKQIHAALVDDPEFRARFEREIRVSMQVSGAFTAALIDFELSGPAPWLASVFIPGVPLDSAVRHYGPLPVPAARTLAAGLAAALYSLHATGLIHRDLKPANVILAADGPRVIDFGIAQLTEPHGAITQTGSLMGSPAYMSPEQATAQPLTPASDIFAFGSLLYMTVVGQSPFAAATAPAALFNIAHREPDYDRVPPELRELVAGCLRKEPRARPTPAQILDYLGAQPVQARPWPAPVHDRIIDQTRYLTLLVSDPDATQIIGDQPVPPAAPAHPAEPSRRSRRPWILAAAAAAVVLLLTVTGLLIVNRDNALPVAAGPETPTASLPALDTLRAVDTCRWVRDALGAELPTALATGIQRDLTAWPWAATASWGCTAGGGGQAMRVEVGSGLAGFAPTGRVVRGYEQLRRGTDCAFATGDPDRRWGISVELGRDRCDLAEYVLDRLLSTNLTTLPITDEHARSLIGVDPCALFADLGEHTAGAGQVVSARSCRWPGVSQTTVTLALDARVSSAVDRPRVKADDDGAFSTSDQCVVRYLFRDIGERFEESVTITTQQPRSATTVKGKLCGELVATIPAMADRLPQP